MSDDGGSLIPITDEQAKALQEACKLGSNGLEMARAFGGYLAKVLGTTPEDIVGLLGGDWLRARRVENTIELARQTQARLEARKVEPEPAALSVALPLLTYAADESRPEILDLWARLLAAAMDPNRSTRVRQSFIDTVKAMDPADALVFQYLPTLEGSMPSNEHARDHVRRGLGIGVEEADISLQHLIALRCMRDRDANPDRAAPLFVGRPSLTSFGKELLRVLNDAPLV